MPSCLDPSVTTNPDGNPVSATAGRVTTETARPPKTAVKSGPGIVDRLLPRHPLIAEPLRLVPSHPQTRRNAIVVSLRLVPLAE
jgi:hypothetical protein